MPLSTDLVSSVLSLFTIILKSDTLGPLVTSTLNFWRSSRFRGTYTVESHHATLELKDSQGHVAVYSKQQRVKFIQDNVFAIQDQAWGDGEIFADYRCSPGVAADIFKEGYRYKILISLRSTKNKGDMEDVVIEQTVKDGFITPVGNFRTQIDHPTGALFLSVIFPASRPPKNVTLIEQNIQRSLPLGSEYRQYLSDGRIKYQWETKKPRLFEGYILRWEW